MIDPLLFTEDLVSLIVGQMSLVVRWFRCVHTFTYNDAFRGSGFAYATIQDLLPVT